MKKKIDRRKFFTGLFTASGAVMASDAKGAPKTKKLLTPDGKLVEVDANVLKHSNKEKANNQEILKWTKSPNS